MIASASLFKRSLATASLSALLCAHVHAAVITLTPSKDATIYGASMNQGLPNSSGQDLFNHSNGAGPGIFAGGNGQLAPHRALIEFDIASALPAGAVITSAQLTMHIGIVAGSGGAPGLGDQTPRTMDLFRLTRDWGEGTTGANATTVGGTGQGFPANVGDATWLQSAYQQVSWTTPGGDHVADVSSSLAVGSVFGSAQTWSSTALMVSDVQGWLDNPSSNDGWILINRDENLKQTHRAFYSSEWPDAAMRPQLQITYELAPVPEPGSTALLLAGLALLGWRASARRGRKSLPD
ncbi:DNRLRE domain-containing protein [Paucibacter sp. R3-3]|uniref:DNRLRE domain-containing protein n=1 Tax=Roseateles agri TaxID=3098619 RepID=A0ABU5DSJ8_9BURK|nr:DNRLRE domain-containing protein [Paucibacter sp. R3-3]MDY0748680.1 DNRLRE domain-containing protein [Paucibacter sp. R3-3]